MKPIVSLLLLSLLVVNFVHGQNPLRFQDVTRSIGVDPKPGRKKWGGPCVADLDGDGIYDLILSYHQTESIDVYWGRADGTFTRDAFRQYGDMHGITVAHRTAGSQTRLISINKGGARGANLRAPSIYTIDKNRNFRNISASFGLGVGKSRGRLTMFMDLSLKDIETRRSSQSGPDLLVVGFSDYKNVIPQFAYSNNGGFFNIRTPGEFKNVPEERVAVADIDGDKVMELISFPRLRVFKLTAPFRFVDISASVFGTGKFYTARSGSGVVEFDMNNRGQMDLFVARARLIDLFPTLPRSSYAFDDILFKQTPGGLFDISNRAGIPKGTRSTSVIAGDYDNDGFVDLFIPTYVGSDYFLMNTGNETFTRVNSVIPKQSGVPGGHAVAVDYDLDGRVDLIVGQGEQESVTNGGPYRIMRNVLPRSSNRNYLLVRVGIHPGRVATPLHAYVEVRVGGMKMSRRVGGSGAQLSGDSYLETVHFGLGRFTRVDAVKVRWIAGAPAMKFSVAANQKITFGIVD